MSGFGDPSTASSILLPLVSGRSSNRPTAVCIRASFGYICLWAFRSLCLYLSRLRARILPPTWAVCHLPPSTAKSATWVAGQKHHFSNKKPCWLIQIKSILEYGLPPKEQLLPRCVAPPFPLSDKNGWFKFTQSFNGTASFLCLRIFADFQVFIEAHANVQNPGRSLCCERDCSGVNGHKWPAAGNNYHLRKGLCELPSALASPSPPRPHSKAVGSVRVMRVVRAVTPTQTVSVICRDNWIKGLFS